MKAHYMQSCRLSHFNRLLWQNREDIDWKGQWKHIGYVYGTALILELPGLVERGLYHSRIKNTQVEKPPLFILGHWRSGTTYLFNLLSQDPDTAFMDSVSTFTFDHFLTMSKILTPIYNKELDGSRPGDTMEWRAESPQEEAYAMANMVEASFAHMITFPRNAEEYIRLNFADHMTAKQRGKWEQSHRYILKKMTYAKEGKRILFKSPDNTAKAKMLYELYPDAKFINIYRDPYKVLMSTLNMFRVGVPAMSFEEMPSDEWLEDMAIQQFKLIYQQYFEDCKSIPANQLVEVGYSDLTKAPMETLESIYDRLELPGFAAAKPRFQAHVDSQSHYQVNKFHLESRLQQKINDQLGFYFEHYGFPVREVEEQL